MFSSISNIFLNSVRPFQESFSSKFSDQKEEEKEISIKKDYKIPSLKELIATSQPESTQEVLAQEDPELLSVAYQKGRCHFLISKLNGFRLKVGFWQNFWLWVLFICASYINTRAATEIIPKNLGVIGFISKPIVAGFISTTLVYICKEGMNFVLLKYQLMLEAETDNKEYEENVSSTKGSPVTQKQWEGFYSGFFEIQSNELKKNPLQNFVLITIVTLLTVEAIAIISNGIENRESWFILLGTPLLAICFSLGCGWFKAHYISYPKHQQQLAVDAQKQLDAIDIDNLNQSIEQTNQVTQEIFNRENPQNQEQNRLRQDMQAKEKLKVLRRDFNQQHSQTLQEIQQLQKPLLDQLEEHQINSGKLGISNKIKQINRQMVRFDLDKERRCLSIINKYLVAIEEVDYQFNCNDRGYYKNFEQELISRRDSTQKQVESFQEKLRSASD